MKKSQKSSRSIAKKMKQELKYLSLAVLIVIGIFFLLLSPFYKLTEMTGYYMQPTIHNQEILVVERHGSLKRFDVICFKNPFNNKLTIGRVIGLPGDELFYQADQLYLNGEGKPERYLNQQKSNELDGDLTEDFNLLEATGEAKVPNDSYFVLSDNRQYNFDSRDFGFVPQKKVVGKVKN